MIFEKQNMFYKDYEWTNYPSSSPKISGKIDATRFDKNQGHEVLYLINKLMELWNFNKVESCTKMERCLREKLPTKINKQDEVATWLQINWNSISLQQAS